jgi:peptidyl-prolyl cis-trans isomerase B (cyclophilin B)
MTYFLFCSLFLFSACDMNTPEPTNDNEAGTQTEQNDTSATNTADTNPNEIVPQSQSADADATSADDDFDQTAMPTDGDLVATVNTNMGSFSIRFFPQFVPKTVENFTTHAQNGYYDDIIFHRVISGFMVQGGDPQGLGIGGESIWGDKFDDEFNENLSNIRGSISMANSGPNTNGSQFFINQADNTFLDFNVEPLSSKHSVFGQVYEGMDTVDEIAAVRKDARDKPLEDVMIESIEVSTYGE